MVTGLIAFGQNAFGWREAFRFKFYAVKVHPKLLTTATNLVHQMGYTGATVQLLHDGGPRLIDVRRKPRAGRFVDVTPQMVAS